MQNEKANLVGQIVANLSGLDESKLRQLLVEIVSPEPQVKERLCRRREVADLLGVGVRSVDNFSRQGLLRRVLFPNRSRASGYRISDVMNLIAGRHKQAPKRSRDPKKCPKIEGGDIFGTPPGTFSGQVGTEIGGVQ